MTDELDIRYASFRDHAEVRERLVALETGLRTDVSEIKAMLMRPSQTAVAPPHELQGLSLAIQRMMDALDRRSDVGGGGGVSVIVRALAIVGAISLGALGMYFFLHH